MILSFDAITWQPKDVHSHHEGLDKIQQDAQLSSDNCRSCFNGIVSNDNDSTIPLLIEIFKRIK